MGTQMAPAFALLANLFMEDLKSKYLNNIHPNIKFTSDRSTTSIPFLDVNIQLHNGKIETYLYCKPTDKHQYLMHSSSHPYHIKKSIPYCLALRLAAFVPRIISLKPDHLN